MGETVQLIVLPSAVSDGLPQVLLDDGGIWRDTIPSQAVIAKQSELRKIVESHLSRIMSEVGGQPPTDVIPTAVGFRTPFTQIFKDVLAREVRTELTRAADAASIDSPPLLKLFLHPSTEWLPWELLHDGTDFLGIRFAVARLPIVREATEVRGARERDVRSVYSLLARDVLQDGILDEWERTFAGYATGADWEHRYPPTGGALEYPDLDHLVAKAKRADIVHVTCHGGLKDGSNYYWTLDLDNPKVFNYRITATVAEMAALENRPLVFGNACASAATNASDLGALYGFGANFMIGGALNFIGTFAPITKRMAVMFARRFYSQLLGTGAVPGRPIAEALWATKKSFADQGVGDPSYLFYSLFGPPDIVYRPA